MIHNPCLVFSRAARRIWFGWGTWGIDTARFVGSASPLLRSPRLASPRFSTHLALCRQDYIRTYPPCSSVYLGPAIRVARSYSRQLINLPRYSSTRLSSDCRRARLSCQRCHSFERPPRDGKTRHNRRFLSAPRQRDEIGSLILVLVLSLTPLSSLFFPSCQNIPIIQMYNVYTKYST